MRKSDDLISRRATYLALVEKGQASKRYRLGETWELNGKEISKVLDNLPSAQPEIIRCKDCKYQDKNQRRVSVKWLPCMDVRTGSNWYCGSAERKENSDG